MNQSWEIIVDISVTQVWFSNRRAKWRRQNRVNAHQLRQMSGGPPPHPLQLPPPVSASQPPTSLHLPPPPQMVEPFSASSIAAMMAAAAASAAAGVGSFGSANIGPGSLGNGSLGSIAATVPSASSCYTPPGSDRADQISVTSEDNE